MHSASNEFQDDQRHQADPGCKPRTSVRPGRDTAIDDGEVLWTDRCQRRSTGTERGMRRTLLPRRRSARAPNPAPSPPDVVPKRSYVAQRQRCRRGDECASVGDPCPDGDPRLVMAPLPDERQCVC